MIMRKSIWSWALVLLLGVFLAGCGINKESRALRVLRHCDFQLVGLDSLTLAGVDISRMLQSDQQIDLSSMPALAMAYFRQDLPMTANVQVEIHNPTNKLAGIRAFEYIILLDDTEVLDGTSDLPIEVPPHSTTITPIQLNANIYKLLSNEQNLRKMMRFLNSNRSASPNGTNQAPAETEKLHLTFKIKPTYTLGNQPINYPGYITVRKTLDPSMIKW